MNNFLRRIFWSAIAIGIAAIGFCFPTSFIGILFPIIGFFVGSIGFVMFSDVEKKSNKPINKDIRFNANLQEDEEPNFTLLKDLDTKYLSNRKKTEVKQTTKKAIKNKENENDSNLIR